MEDVSDAFCFTFTKILWVFYTLQQYRIKKVCDHKPIQFQNVKEQGEVLILRAAVDTLRNIWNRQDYLSIHYPQLYSVLHECYSWAFYEFGWKCFLLSCSSQSNWLLQKILLTKYSPSFHWNYIFPQVSKQLLCASMFKIIFCSGNFTVFMISLL